MAKAKAIAAPDAEVRLKKRKENGSHFKPGGKGGPGRPKGLPNKATAEIKELARQYVPEAMIELARLAKEAESEPARVAAIKELFDRAYGKATQHIDANVNLSHEAALEQLE